MCTSATHDHRQARLINLWHRSPITPVTNHFNIKPAHCPSPSAYHGWPSVVTPSYRRLPNVCRLAFVRVLPPSCPSCSAPSRPFAQSCSKLRRPSGTYQYGGYRASPQGALHTRLNCQRSVRECPGNLCLCYPMIAALSSSSVACSSALICLAPMPRKPPSFAAPATWLAMFISILR